MQVKSNIKGEENCEHFNLICDTRLHLVLTLERPLLLEYNDQETKSKAAYYSRNGYLNRAMFSVKNVSETEMNQTDFKTDPLYTKNMIIV